MEKIIATILSIIVLIPVAVTGVDIYNSGVVTVSDSFEYSESTDELSNPYCGWYSMYGYFLTDGSSDQFDNTTSKYLSNSTNTRMILLEINLKNFNNSPLTANALAQLDHTLNLWENEGHNLIVRFLYDWDGKAMETEPSEFETIKTHMSQVAAIINSHVSSVYIMQGIFVGDFAEMHSSHYMDEEHMTELANYLDSIIDKRIYLSVRTPQHLRTILGTASLPDVESTVKGNSGNFRIGLYNDGMLGSSIDVGTYGSSDMQFTSDNYKSKGNRAQEIQYQNTLCLMVPNGGEAVLDNPYNDIDNAAVDLASMHVSYLNKDHDLSVMNKWSRQIYTGNDAFYGSTARHFISTHLGYRYVLRSASIACKSYKNTVSLQLSVDNVGFAPAYRNFNVYVTVESTDSEGNSTFDVVDVSDQTCVRTWYPGQTSSVNLSVPASVPESGMLTFYIKITDASTGETIRLANNMELEGNGYCLGSLALQ